jgi:hypothetical protein
VDRLDSFMFKRLENQRRQRELYEVLCIRTVAIENRRNQRARKKNSANFKHGASNLFIEQQIEKSVHQKPHVLESLFTRCIMLVEQRKIFWLTLKFELLHFNLLYCEESNWLTYPVNRLRPPIPVYCTI